MMDNDAYNTIFKLGSIRCELKRLCDTPGKCLLNLKKYFKLKLTLIRNKDNVEVPMPRPVKAEKLKLRRKLKRYNYGKMKLPHFYKPEEKLFENDERL